MTITSDKYLKLVRDSNEERERAAMFFAEHLPDFPLEPSQINASIFGGMPWLTFPYDRAIIKMLEEFLTAAGWTQEHDRSEAEVGTGEDPRQTWRKKSAGRNEYPFWPELIVSFSDTAEGAVCKRKKIGTRVQETPIYEWACPE